MSKTITIQEAGVPKSLNGVRKLNTKNSDGGATNWIPEDETEVGTLTITANGEYVASGSGLYGYSRVLVLVPGGGDVTVDGRTINVAPGGEGSAITGTIDGVPCRMYVDGNGNLVTETL